MLQMYTQQPSSHVLYIGNSERRALFSRSPTEFPSFDPSRLHSRRRTERVGREKGICLYSRKCYSSKEDRHTRDCSYLRVVLLATITLDTRFEKEPSICKRMKRGCDLICQIEIPMGYAQCFQIMIRLRPIVSLKVANAFRATL